MAETADNSGFFVKLEVMYFSLFKAFWRLGEPEFFEYTVYAGLQWKQVKHSYLSFLYHQALLDNLWGVAVHNPVTQKCS